MGKGEVSDAEVKEAMIGPDFSDPSSVVSWYGAQIIHFLGLMKKEKAASRLRILNSSIDSWARAFRLSADTSELSELKNQLDELKATIQAQQRIRAIK